ncbi:MAG: hypothetical protein DLM69_12470 [Candidatus Chloroheliales bacterium]|nr:MAG: hypothetical protein DLM69_12470 [Chloroflexota bacterium]
MRESGRVGILSQYVPSKPKTWPSSPARCGDIADPGRRGVGWLLLARAASKPSATISYLHDLPLLRPTLALSQTDELTFGPKGNQAAHHDQVSGLVWQGQTTGYYETTQDHISDSGWAITATGSVTFTIALDPANRSVLLRRRLDYTVGYLRGRVSVDGQPVGVWYTPGSNKYKSWRDEEFLLPASATSGKRSVTLRIDAEADPHAPPAAAAWNEFHYWAYCIL